MKVKLIAYTPDGAATIAKAAKLCYSPVGVEAIEKKLDETEVARFVAMLADMGHESPMEHISFTFAVEGVSRVLTHQLVRHRLASYSQQSQRYVRLDQFEYIIPKAIEKDETAKARFIQSMEDAHKAYEELADELKAGYVNELTDQGMDEKKAARMAEKRAIEDLSLIHI